VRDGSAQVRLLEYRRVLAVREYSRILLADMNDVLFQEPRAHTHARIHTRARAHTHTL
jgi:hypothetical protein